LSIGGLETFSRHLSSLEAALREVRSTALELDCRAVSDDLVVEIDRLHSHDFTVVVLGEFSRGKTTLVNALLGQRLLPAKVRPTTAVLTFIRHADTTSVTVETADGETRELEPARLAKAITGKGWSGAPVSAVHVRAPIDWLPEGVQLVDTPGVSDICSVRESVTLDFLPRADAVVFLLDAKACFNESEKRFLQRDVLQANVRRIFFVVNKADQLSPPYDPEQLSMLRSRIEKHLAGICEQPSVLFVAAKAALNESLGSAEPGPGRAGMRRLIDTLGAFMVADRGRILLERATAIGERSLQTLMERVALELSALEADAADGQALLDQAQRRHQDCAEQLRRREQAWSKTTAAIITAEVHQVAAQAREIGQSVLTSFDGWLRSTEDYARAEAECNRTLAEAFTQLGETSQRRLAETLHQAATVLGHDLEALEGNYRMPSSSRAASTFTMPTYDAPLLTPLSATVSLGVMGGVALLTSLTGVGVLLVGVAAFLGMRYTEAQEEEKRSRLVREAQQRVERAVTAIEGAIHTDGQQHASTLWSEASSGLSIRLRESERAVQLARDALNTSTERRSARGADLRAFRAQLLERLHAFRAAADEALMEARRR
jgi:GTPase SAR1 family protein